MAEFKPNKQQQEFLDVDNCSVLVSASAGSGKTSTMIQKLIRIILQGKVPVTSLLVVTYTNAAASEIKLKLFNELTRLINSSEEVEFKSFLKEQLDNINNAEIGTLHAICKKLIVKYFYKINESPNFALLSEKEEKYLLDSAIENIFKKHIVKSDNDFFELYDCYNSKRSDIQLKNMCLQLYNYKCSKTDYNAWQNQFLSSSYNLDLNANSACNFVLEHYQKVFIMFSSAIMSLKKQSSGMAFNKYDAFLDNRLQFINEINQVPDFETGAKVLGNLKLPNKPMRSKNASVDEIVFDESVESFHKFFSEQLKHFKEDMTSSNIEDIRGAIANARKNVVTLMSVVDEIEGEYSKIKKNKNVLDFNDLESKMLTLLEDEEVKNHLKSQYQYIFVDEYQDINDKQESILMSLASEDNYYMIGDVKQSIYAFRQSSPKIFISKYNNFAREGNSNKVINFNANYRSDINILEFANSVFDNIITRETIGIDYSKDARFISNKEFVDCNVALNIINADEELEDKELCEAEVIASEIARLVTSKRPDGTRYEYSDIAIILRQRGSFVRTLVNVLTKMKIPVSTSVNSDFFNTSEIKLLVAILQVVSNYRNDLAVATVLKNLFNVSEDELMNIRSYDEDLTFHECVLQYDKKDNIAHKIGLFKSFIKRSQNDLLTLTLKDYLDNVINDFKILLKCKLSPSGKEKESNILEFLSIIDNDNYKFSLDKFLEYIEFVSKEKSLQHIGVDTNAVEICTIHHSKGLEYPIVIMGGMGKNFQLNKDSGNVIINSQFGVGLKSINNIGRTLDETIIRNACKLDNKKSEIDEEIRLLYVAMTRAKEKLSIVGTYNLSAIADKKSRRIYSSKNYFDLIFKSIENIYLHNFMNKTDFIIREGQANCAKIKVYSLDDFQDEEVVDVAPVILNANSNELIKQLSKVFANRPNTKTTTIKNTVTNILREESDYEVLNYLPKTLSINDKVPSKDVLKLGTTYHTIMQELTFKETDKDICALIENLVQQGRIDRAMSELVDVSQVVTAVRVLKDLISNAKEVYKEKQFLLCENYNKLIKSTDNNTRVIVQGVIDLVVVSEEGTYLIDYKTNRGITETQLVDEYRIQLDLYSHAFELATGVKVSKKFLYSFSLGKLIEVI